MTARSCPPSSRPAGQGEAPASAAFAGQAACVECHPSETAAWQRSQHAHALQPATADTVLGNFDGANVTFHGTTSTFVRRGDAFVVRTDGPDGALADFEVKYTFGVWPLQQYLIPFPDGRMQALSIAWDARSQAAGGQRWFQLYPDEQIDHRDPLHWTRRYQTWNSACADCHSTNLRTNYDATLDRYATTWTDMSVACEACHGPAAAHVAWARHNPETRSVSNRGLTVALDERRAVQWLPTAAGNSVRDPQLVSHREVETCAVCHARRTPLGSDSQPTGRLLDTHAPALLDEGLYFADGQQDGEVYTYGSFVQSKMYARGVTCSDCHDPHSGTLRAEGNALCAQCHAPATYERSRHLLHDVGSAGAQCIACHAPGRTYMGIDVRHDHSFRIPRPDLSVRFGVPDACTPCHTDRDARWAAGVIEATYGSERRGYQTFVEALAIGRTGAAGADRTLAALARDPAIPAIARATALASLPRFPGSAARAALKLALADPDALIRAAALNALEMFTPPERGDLAEPLANDAIKMVRVQAGRTLAAVPLDGLSPTRRAVREHALAEFVSSKEARADSPEAHLELGIFYVERGDAQRAEANYRMALNRQPDLVPAALNLADLYRSLRRETDAAAVVEQGLALTPDDPSLLHALGLQRVRTGRIDDALPLLARAAAGRPDSARFAHAYAVALHSTGRLNEATAVLQAAIERAPYDRDLLFALSTFERDAGNLAQAREHAARLVAVAPEDATVRELARRLGVE